MIRSEGEFDLRMHTGEGATTHRSTLRRESFMSSMCITPRLPGRAIRLLGVSSLFGVPFAHAQSSASNAILGASLNSAGGLSASTNNLVTACIGNDIAGFSSSASFQAEIGCGPYAIGLAYDAAAAGVSTNAIPGLATPALVLLAFLMAVFVVRRLGRMNGPVRPRP